MTLDQILDNCQAIPEDWAPYILNPNTTRIGDMVSWSGDSSQTTGKAPTPLTVKAVNDIRDARHYSFMVVDGSLIQLRYIFNSHKSLITAANLSFLKAYPDGYLSTSQIMKHGDEWDRIGFFESLPEDKPVGGFRLDYAPKDVNGPLHGECHFHIHGLDESRLLFDKVPSPRRFVEFVFALCYPEIYKDKRLDAKHRLKPNTNLVFLEEPKVAIPYSQFPRFARLLINGV